MVVEVYCDVKIPELSAQIVNKGVMKGDASEILDISLYMFLYLFLSLTSGIVACYTATKASVSFACDLRSDIFTKIQSFSFANTDTFSTGSLVTRLTNDITQLQQLVATALRLMFRAPGMLIGSLLMAYTIDAKMSITFMVLVPLLALVSYITLYFSYKRFAVLQVRVDSLNNTIQEFLTNIKIIKALTREAHEGSKFNDVNNELKKSYLSAYKISILKIPLLTFVVNIAVIAILWTGNMAFGRGEILIGDISAFITYLTQILMSVVMMSMVFLQASRGLVSAKRINEVVDETIDITDKDAKQVTKKVGSGDIIFENVSFKYHIDSELDVLTNITLHIESGQTVGIIGATGCGKTSLVHLILRLYDTTQGSVYVDGTNVKDYSLKNLRSGIAIVLQNDMLFSGTIKENLLRGNVNATEEEYVQATKGASIYSFIQEKEYAFEDTVEQAGVNVSGGQKQRLCIARALLKNAPILIFDDSTSAVDMATERAILQYLQKNNTDQTKIIIAQRISSVKNADTIIVIEEGAIVSKGTHTQLLQNSLIYKEIYTSQVEGSIKSLKEKKEKKNA